MSAPLFLLVHLGMGDAILSNGLARELAKSQPIIFPCATPYLESIRFMFRDCDQIQVQPYANQDAACAACDQYQGNKLKLGFYADPDRPFCKEVHFDESFYVQAKLDPALKRRGFKVEYDPAIELPAPSEPFIFCHEVKVSVPGHRTLSPDFKINRNFFAYRKWMMEAQALHFKDSSFACWSDCSGIGYGRRWHHRYAKPMEDCKYITLAEDWNIIYNL